MKKDALSKMNNRLSSIIVHLSKIDAKAVSLLYFFYFLSLLSALCKGYSCQSILLNMIVNIKCALDKGEYIACTSMDINKGFGGLICKLHA